MKYGKPQPGFVFDNILNYFGNTYLAAPTSQGAKEADRTIHKKFHVIKNLNEVKLITENIFLTALRVGAFDIEKKVQ